MRLFSPPSLVWKLLENKRFTKRRDLNWTGDFPPHFKRNTIEMCVLQISNAVSLLIKCGTRGTGMHLRKYLRLSLPPVSSTFLCYGYMRFWALDNLTKTINNENIMVWCLGCLVRQSRFPSEAQECNVLQIWHKWF